MLRTRAFGGVDLGKKGTTIDVAGRALKRTWSVLATPLRVGDTSLDVVHDPVAMGWRVGDRIVVAS